MKRPHAHYRRLLTAPRILRVGLGFLLIVGGVLGFLPVLGFWMIPLGLLVIFFEAPWVRERWRRARAWSKGQRSNRKPS